jgi:hypothetical protein
MCNGSIHPINKQQKTRMRVFCFVFIGQQHSFLMAAIASASFVTRLSKLGKNHFDIF